MIVLSGSVLPIIGLAHGMELVGHNLPTNSTTPAMCVIKYNGYMREHILIRVGECYEPYEDAERIYYEGAVQTFTADSSCEQGIFPTRSRVFRL